MTFSGFFNQKLLNSIAQGAKKGIKSSYTLFFDVFVAAHNKSGLAGRE